jgi:hypothetical protein
MNTFSRFKIGSITVSLLVAALLWVPIADAAPGHKATAKDKSDLNKDHVVDNADLVIFSTRYLNMDWETVDWCAFYEATSGEGDLYGRDASYYPRHFPTLLAYINTAFSCDLSDLNNDQVVDMTDLVILSTRYLELDWNTVDWCDFYEATLLDQRYKDKFTHYYKKRYRLLLGFIYDTFGCDNVFLTLIVKNQPKSQVRAAVNLHPDPQNDNYGYYYVSDAVVGSVFIYDPDMVLVGELPNLDKPLGVAIDSQGYLLVGNNGRNNIEVYDPANGDLLYSFGEGMVQMPTSITIGPNGDIYVTDGKANCVWVFESSYLHVRTIGTRGSGDGQLKTPKDSAIITRAGVEEIYISDQGNRRIQVFDTQGSYLRAVLPPMPDYPQFCWGCPEARGTFTRLQALGFDRDGRLHSLDIFEASVTILNLVNSEVLGSYGAFGNGPGLVNTPLDLLLINSDEAVMIDNKSPEIEFFDIPGLPQ